MATSSSASSGTSSLGSSSSTSTPSFTPCIAVKVPYFLPSRLDAGPLVGLRVARVVELTARLALHLLLREQRAHADDELRPERAFRDHPLDRQVAASCADLRGPSASARVRCARAQVASRCDGPFRSGFPKSQSFSRWETLTFRKLCVVSCMLLAWSGWTRRR